MFQLKTLLERAVKERCDTYSDRQELLELGLPVPPPATMKASSKVGNQEEYAPFINEEADLPTIHEAYQYLNKGLLEVMSIVKFGIKIVLHLPILYASTGKCFYFFNIFVYSQCSMELS